jgi:hypothetical protein
MRLQKLVGVAAFALNCTWALGFQSVFPVTTTPPAGWQFSALNGLNNTASGHTGPAVITDPGEPDTVPPTPGGRSVLRLSVDSPYTSTTTIRTGEASNMQFKYDLSSFSGDEIAFGSVFRARGVAGRQNQGEALLSLSLPDGPGIAIVAGHNGTVDNSDFGLYTDFGFHLYQFRQSPGRIAPNVSGVDYLNFNLQGATRRLAQLIVAPDEAITNTGGIIPDWKTNYHTFWLYVNRSTKRILVQVDDLPAIDMALTPLNRIFNHDNLPPNQYTNDPAVYSSPYPTDWDTTGYAQFGARDYDVHSEYPEWAPTTPEGYYYNWPTGQNFPQPYNSTDSRIFFGGGEDDGVLNGNVAVLTTDFSVTPFAFLLCKSPFADADGDQDVDMDDFGVFQTCYSGSDPRPSTPAYCFCFDRDTNSRIDETDFAAFTACATGAGVPWSATPACP